MKEYKNKLYPVLESMENKIKMFENILNAKRLQNIQIHFFADGKHTTINQLDSPYNLQHELRNLLEAMVDQINNDIEILKLEHNEKGNN